MNHYRIQPLALFAFHSSVPNATVTIALQASRTLQTYFGTNSIQSYHYVFFFYQNTSTMFVFTFLSCQVHPRHCPYLMHVTD